MAAATKGKSLLYTCAAVSTVAIVVIVLDILGLFQIPGKVTTSPIGSSTRFDLNFFLTYNLFPVLIVLNLVLWAFTAVSGRMLHSRPGMRSLLSILYMLVAVVLLAILAYRMVFA